MVFPSGASVSIWIFCNSCIWVRQSSSVWKDGSLNHTVQIHKNAAKTKNLWELKDFFLKNSRQFNCSGQTRDSWTTITKQKNTAVDHSGNSIKNEGDVNFWTGSNSALIFSCGLYVNIFYVKYLIQVSNKLTITWILYDPSCFAKIINILQILLTSTVYMQKVNLVDN